MAAVAPDAAVVIEARAGPAFAALARRLAHHAATLAARRVENLPREAASDPTRWRDARLLWPLFTKD